MEPAFRYILRYTIDPSFHAEERMDELIKFCVKSTIEEVMLFFLAEELSTGHPTLEEIKPWVAAAKELKTGLDKHGLSLSLNPWCTVYHAPRGRSLRPGQDFSLMVGETGVQSSVAVCPLCTNWQNYLCELFAYMVRELHPAALWVEEAR